MSSNVTLLSAYTARDANLLGLNIRGTKLLNPNSSFQWIAIDNSSGRANPTTGDLSVKVYAGLNEKHIGKYLIKRASDLVGMSLNYGLTKVNTRFVCVLDPDFYVLYPNWITATATYMDAAGVGILTAPHHPMWYDKRNKVTNNFIMIDTELAPKALLNFIPSKTERFAFSTSFISKLRRRVFGKRADIRRKLDCGDQIEKRFGHLAEYLTVYYDPDKQPNTSKLDKLVDKILPDKWTLKNTLVPTLPYASETDDSRYHHLYFWRGILYGLHFRSFGNRLIKSDFTVDEEIIRNSFAIIYQTYKNFLIQEKK